MAKCQNCDLEVDENVSHCPECGEKIDWDSEGHDELMTDVEWVTVAERTGAVLGYLIKSRLESIDIPANLTGATVGSMPTYVGFDTKIQVPKRFFEEAKAIVDEMMKSSDEGLFCNNCGSSVNEEDKECPNCGELFFDYEDEGTED